MGRPPSGFTFTVRGADERTVRQHPRNAGRAHRS